MGISICSYWFPFIGGLYLASNSRVKKKMRRLVFILLLCSTTLFAQRLGSDKNVEFTHGFHIWDTKKDAYCWYEWGNSYASCVDAMARCEQLADCNRKMVCSFLYSEDVEHDRSFWCETEYMDKTPQPYFVPFFDWNIDDYLTPGDQQK